MQYSRYFHVFRFYSIIHINVAMIIFHTKPEYPCIATCITFCKPFIFQKTLCTVACMFDLKPGIFFNFIDTESAVTRTDQSLWIPNDSSCSRKCFSFKKFIERAVLFLLILIHRNLVLPDKPRNQHSGDPRIQKRSSDFRDMWIDQSLHKQPSCFMRVNPFQQPILS